MNILRITTRWLATTCVLLAINAAAADRDGMPGAQDPGQQLDCAKLAGMPNPPMSLDSCRQLAGAARAQTAAANDPSAARPGDQAMSCADIAAEMCTMKGVGLSQAQQRENAAAAAGYQGKLAEQQAEINRMGMEGTAATNAGLAADTLAQIATGGLFKPGAAQAAQQAYQARAAVRGQEMVEERRPAEQRMTGAMATARRPWARVLNPTRASPASCSWPWPSSARNRAADSLAGHGSALLDPWAKAGGGSSN
jgi:hypothetical protein